jgi:hypothetical protein
MLKQTIPTGACRQDNRGVWRIGANDVEDFIAEAYLRTAERIAHGDLKIDGEPDR